MVLSLTHSVPKPPWSGLEPVSMTPLHGLLYYNQFKSHGYMHSHQYHSLAGLVPSFYETLYHWHTDHQFKVICVFPQGWLGMHSSCVCVSVWKPKEPLYCCLSFDHPPDPLWWLSGPLCTREVSRRPPAGAPVLFCCRFEGLIFFSYILFSE